MESFEEIKRSIFPKELQEDAPEALKDTIMIIDDNVDIVEALTSLLRPHYRVISSLSYEDTIKKLSVNARLVLLDIKMASKDGVEVFKLLKEQNEKLPIIFHSAYPGSSERAAEVEQLNHNGYLTKGEYNTPGLLSKITAALGQSVAAEPARLG